MQKPDYETAVAYWSSQPASVDGMLGGYGTGRVPRLDVQHSSLFLRQMISAGQLRSARHVWLKNKTGEMNRAETIEHEEAKSAENKNAESMNGDSQNHQSTVTRQKRRKVGASADAAGRTDLDTRERGQTQGDYEEGPTVLHNKDDNDMVHTVDCGAGIGRVTRDLLLQFSDVIDIVEPCVPFTDNIKSSPELQAHIASGAIRHIYTIGIQDFLLPSTSKKDENNDTADNDENNGVENTDDASNRDEKDDVTRNDRKQYDIIWNQWCLGQLDDNDLIPYLRRCKSALKNTQSAVFVKENVAAVQDVFDQQDSSWTRTEAHFLEIFRAAGLRVVKSSVQHGFPKELFQVKLWALK